MRARSRGAQFRERDVARAIRAARMAGEKGKIRVEIENGKLVVIACPLKAEEPSREGSLDKWLADHLE